jgi:hypothetical protein
MIFSSSFATDEEYAKNDAEFVIRLEGSAWIRTKVAESSFNEAISVNTKGPISSGGSRNTSGLIMSSISSGVPAHGVMVEGFVLVLLLEVLFDLSVGEAVSLGLENMLEVDLTLELVDTLALLKLELVDRVETADSFEVADMLELVVEEEIVELEYLKSDERSSADRT